LFISKALANELTIFGAKYANALSSGIKTGSSNDNEGFRQLQSNIEDWAIKKGIRPMFNKGKIGKHTYRNLAFLISKSIRQKGIPKRFGYQGSGFIQAVKVEMEKKITDIIFEGYKKDLEEKLEIITNKK